MPRFRIGRPLSEPSTPRMSTQLKQFPPFFDDLVWEREYRAVEWKEVPYRKTITEFFRRIDDHVRRSGQCRSLCHMKEAKRLLAPHAIGFSSFDAGTADMKVLERSGEALLWPVRRATEFHGQFCVSRSGRQAVGGRHDDHRKPA